MRGGERGVVFGAGDHLRPRESVELIKPVGVRKYAHHLHRDRVRGRGEGDFRCQRICLDVVVVGIKPTFHFFGVDVFGIDQHLGADIIVFRPERCAEFKKCGDGEAEQDARGDHRCGDHHDHGVARDAGKRVPEKDVHQRLSAAETIFPSLMWMVLLPYSALCSL